MYYQNRGITNKYKVTMTKFRVERKKKKAYSKVECYNRKL